MARGRSSDPLIEFPDAERLLLDAPDLELLGLLRNSSNYTFLARLAGADLLAVYKPAAGESPLWDYPDGTLYRREVAAYRLARFLGWPSIPPTVVRAAGPHGVGALQLFIHSGDGVYFETRANRPLELLPVAVFDFIANNGDRKAGHHLRDAADRLWVIDHGLTFHVEPKLRTVIWEFAGRPLPGDLRAGLEGAAAALDGAGALRAELDELIRRREREMLIRRLEMALAPGWSLPSPTSSWSVPWPPV